MIRNSLRERYEKKKKERQDILGTGSLLEQTEDKKLLPEGEWMRQIGETQKTHANSFQMAIQRSAW